MHRDNCFESSYYIIEWSGDFDKFEYKVTWDRKKLILVPRCPIPRLIELF
jgi:hypothetical protein